MYWFERFEDEDEVLDEYEAELLDDTYFLDETEE